MSYTHWLNRLGAYAPVSSTHEPLVPDSLKALPHVVLAPHIGGSTFEAHEARQSLVAANIEAFFAGRPVVTPIPEIAR